MLQATKTAMRSRRNSLRSKSEVSVAEEIRGLFQGFIAMLTLNTALFRVSGSKATYWLKPSTIHRGSNCPSVRTSVFRTTEMSLPVTVILATPRK